MAQVLARRPAQRRDNLLDAGIWDGGEDDGQEVADTHAGGKAAAERSRLFPRKNLCVI